MKHFFFVLFVFLLGNCYSQASRDREKILLEIAAIKKNAERTAKIKDYVDNHTFENENHFFRDAESLFNGFYSKKDTLNTLRIFNLLGLRWVLNKKMDSILAVKPIEPFLKKDTPLDIQAGAQLIFYDYLRSQGTKIDEARRKSKKSLELFEKLNDSSYSDWATLHGYIVVDGAQANDFSSIMEHAFAALALLRYQKDENRLVDIQGILATVYSLNYLFEPAKILRDEKIAYAEEIKDYQNLIIENLNAALDEKLQNHYEAQKLHLDKAVAYAEVYNNAHFKFICYHSYLVYASQQEQTENSQKYFDLISALYPQFEGSPFHNILYLEAQAYYQYGLGNLHKAELLALEKLKFAETFNSKEIIQESHELLLLIFEASGQIDKANVQENFVLNYLNNTKEEALKNQLIYYQTIYETEKRDLKLEAQQKNIALLKSRERVRSQWYLISALLLLGIFGTILLIRSRNYARKKQKMQESFTKDLLKTQENEKARIASELHDSVGQKLLMLKNSLVSSEKREQKEIDLVQETIQEVREMSHNLHPFQFEKLGLTKSLKNMVSTFQKNSNVFYSEALEAKEGLISKAKEIYIFRMLQECITNVEKHANATACNLSSEEKKDAVIFTLKDNGNGFVLAEEGEALGGLGMRTLKERAQFIGAILDIKSIPNKGTSITIKVPKNEPNTSHS